MLKGRTCGSAPVSAWIILHIDAHRKGGRPGDQGCSHKCRQSAGHMARVPAWRPIAAAACTRRRGAQTGRSLSGARAKGRTLPLAAPSAMCYTQATCLRGLVGPTSARYGSGSDEPRVMSGKLICCGSAPPPDARSSSVGLSTCPSAILHPRWKGACHGTAFRNLSGTHIWVSSADLRPRRPGRRAPGVCPRIWRARPPY